MPLKNNLDKHVYLKIFGISKSSANRFPFQIIEFRFGKSVNFSLATNFIRTYCKLKIKKILNISRIRINH
jgi:hypothetical protein